MFFMFNDLSRETIVNLFILVELLFILSFHTVYLCQYSLLVVFHVMLENLVGQGNHACSNSNACYDFCIKTMFGSS
jgi:hypothetical protein